MNTPQATFLSEEQLLLLVKCALLDLEQARNEGAFKNVPHSTAAQFFLMESILLRRKYILDPQHDKRDHKFLKALQKIFNPTSGIWQFITIQEG